MFEIKPKSEEVVYFYFTSFFTLQPIRAVRVLFAPMASRRVAGGGKKFVWAVSECHGVTLI